MPAFDPALVLDSNPLVRAANSYQAVLDYLAGRLSGANYALFLVELGNQDLPTSSDDLLSLGEPGRIVEAAQALAFNYIASFPINPTTVATLPQSISSATIGTLSVTGGLTVTNGAFFGATVTVNDNLLILGNLTVTGNISTTADLSVADGSGIYLGTASQTPALPGGIRGSGAFDATHFRLTAALTAASSAAGDLFEDENGDLIFNTIESPSREVPLTRPTHDSGWIGVSSIPSPDPLPDIYAVSGLMQAFANPGEPGGPTRIVVWLKVDKALVDGLTPATGDFYYFSIAAATTAANVFTGIDIQIDGVTGNIFALMPAAGNPILPATDVDVDSDPEPEFRVMLWTR